MSYNAVTGACAQQTATTAANLFIKVLEVEVHEKTLCHTLEMLALWGAKFYNEIPKNVIDAFKVSHFTATPQQIFTTKFLFRMA